MDQVVMRSLKEKYRKKIIQRLVRAVDIKKNVSQNINFTCNEIINIRLIWSIWGNHKKFF